MRRYSQGFGCKLLLFILVIVCGTVAAPAVFAEGPTFTQRILPLNCVFTTVNAGTGQLYYVTPQACGILTPTGSSTPPGAGSTNLATVTSQPALPGLLTAKPPGSQAPAAAQPTIDNLPIVAWHPLVVIPANHKHPTVVKAPAAASASGVIIVGGSLIALIALLVFLL